MEYTKYLIFGHELFETNDLCSQMLTASIWVSKPTEIQLLESNTKVRVEDRQQAGKASGQAGKWASLIIPKCIA